MIGPFELDEIYCGDNVELCRQLPDECIDLIVASPPYDDLRTYNGYAWDFELLAQELYRVTKRGGVVVWVVADATIDGSETGTSFRQALYFMQCGFNLHDTMIYEKDSISFPEANRYSQVFEYMFVFARGAPKAFNVIKDRKNKWSCGQKKIRGGERQADGSIVSRRKARVLKRFGSRFNIWRISGGYQKSSTDKLAYNHPAIFPEKLARDHIISWSNPGQVVLDPFMGSGTTAKAAMQNGRHYLGFEISQEYVDLARKRVAQSNPPLLVAV